MRLPVSFNLGHECGLRKSKLDWNWLGHRGSHHAFIYIYICITHGLFRQGVMLAGVSFFRLHPTSPLQKTEKKEKKQEERQKERNRQVPQWVEHVQSGNDSLK